MSSSGEEGRPITSKTEPFSVRSRRAKFLFGTLVVLCVAAGVAAGAAVFSTSDRNGDRSGSELKPENDPTVS